MLRTGRVCRQATLTDYVLLAVFIILLLVFIQRRGYLNSEDNALDSVRSEDGSFSSNPRAKAQAAVNMVDDRIRKIPDSREKECKSKQYSVDKKVSIIIQFFDYQFYDVKTTIGSVMHHTPKDLIEEIIFVDDGTSLEYIKEDAKNYVTNLQKGKMIELPNRFNNGKAQMKAVESSKGDVLVFLDSTIIVNEGWLEPLLEALQQHPNIIAVPHFDNINDPVSYDYKSTPSNLVTEFSWSLSMRMIQEPKHDDVTKTIDSPMLRGNAFAVNRKFFTQIGAYDENMEDANAQHVELGLRTWLCGGAIKVVPCSKAGVLSLSDAVKVTSQQSIRRLVQLWLDDYGQYVFQNTQTTPDINSKEKNDVKARKDSLSLDCKPFEWYLKNISKTVYTPSAEAKVYGIMKCKTGRCARIGPDKRVDLGQCKADSYNLASSDMIFEYTEKKQVKHHNKCLEVQGSAYVVEEDCKDGETKQQFEYTNNKLINVWSNYCFMHVTDPDKTVPKGRQIMMAQDCGQDNTGEFSSWEFINP